MEPICLHNFEQPTLAVVEIEPDIFCVATCNLYTDHVSYLPARTCAAGSLMPDFLEPAGIDPVLSTLIG